MSLRTCSLSLLSSERMVVEDSARWHEKEHIMALAQSHQAAQDLDGRSESKPFRCSCASFDCSDYFLLE